MIYVPMRLEMIHSHNNCNELSNLCMFMLNTDLFPRKRNKYEPSDRIQADAGKPNVLSGPMLLALIYPDNT